MKYYKWVDEYSEIGGGTTYVETDSGWAIREVTVNGNQYMASNLVDSLGRPHLADGRLIFEDGDDVTEITPPEFEDVWNYHLAKHNPQWAATKNTFPIGLQITGWIMFFFPQGVIINLGDDVLAVADYATCKKSAKPEWMYPRHKITATVDGYDEVNHWVFLAQPQVSSETIGD